MGSDSHNWKSRNHKPMKNIDKAMKEAYEKWLEDQKKSVADDFDEIEIEEDENGNDKLQDM